MRLSSFVALVLSSTATSVLADSCKRWHTVQSGEICDSICQAESVALYQLFVLNPEIDAECTNLMPGQELCLAKPNEDCKQVYQVKPNDTCEEVSEAHGIKLATFFYNNPQVNQDCTNLYIDEVVCVAHDYINYDHGTTTPPPAPSMPSTALPAMPTDTDLPWCD